jgi:restriction system protein
MQSPKYHETFIPILKILSDDSIIQVNELLKLVRDKFYSDLSQELLDQETKSGQNLILNRIHWGKVFLKQAKMIHQPERAMVQITNKGKEALKGGKLTRNNLINDTDFLAHQESVKGKKGIEKEEINENASPQDMIDSGFTAIETQVKNELLEKLRTIDPYYFEKVVLRLLEKMGYGDFQETRKSGDGGIDGIISQDKLGLEKIYIQSKRYAEENKVREPVIRNFIGAMAGDVNKGIVVTTSSFDEPAVKKAHEAHHKIILIDGKRLVDLMHKFNVGVQVQNTYEVKEIDQDFFE